MTHYSNTDDVYFPSTSDIEALVDELDGEDLNKALAHAGVYLSAFKEEKANIVGRFAFGQVWYNQAFQTIDPDKHGFSITGIRAIISDISKLDTYLTSNIGTTYKSLKHRPTILSTASAIEPSGPRTLSVKYTVRRPSRVNILSKEDCLFDLEIRNIGGHRYEFLCHPSRSGDGMVARDLIEFILDEIKAYAISIDLYKLTPEESVKLFGEIEKDTAGEWRVRDVVELTVGTETGKAKIVKTISSAVLHGSDLFNNSKIKSMFSKEDYYYSAIEFTCHRTGAGTVGEEIGDFKVRISFKRNPKILEVDIKQHSILGHLVPAALANTICSYYWARTYALYEQYLATTKGGGKLVAKTPAVSTPSASAPEPTAVAPAPGGASATSAATPGPAAVAPMPGGASVTSAATPEPAAVAPAPGGASATSAAIPKPAAVAPAPGGASATSAAIPKPAVIARPN